MRGKQAKKRVIKPDSKYDSVIVAKLINNVMKQGKKRVAEQIVYSAMESITNFSKEKKSPVELLTEIVENIKPKIEVRSRRVGGVNYQVPSPVPEHRQEALAIKWLIAGARSRRKKEEFYKAFAAEMQDALKGQGFAFKKREDVEKMAEANKAFAHFQW